MEGAGLLEFWLKQYSDDPTYCLTKIQRQMKEKSGKRRLTLNNLSGAFLVLIIGYVLSIIAFILEQCIACWQHRNKNKAAGSPRRAAVVVATVGKIMQNSEDFVVSIVAPENNDILDVVKLVDEVKVAVEVSAATTVVIPPQLKLTSDDAIEIAD